MMSLILFKLIFCSYFNIFQGLNQTTNTPFKDSEKITYIVYYNWGLLWLKAAHVEFVVSLSEYGNRPVYKFFSSGNTYPSYDWFFPVRDTFSSITDTTTLLPLFYRQSTKEGSNITLNIITFEDKKQIIKSNIAKNGSTTVTIQKKFQPPVYDLLSAVYVCRKIDFNKLKLDQKIPIPVFIEDSIYNLYIRFKGREIITTKEEKKYQTIKIGVKLIEGTIFKGDEDMFVWITDDKSRIPVKIEAKILIGSVKAFLVNAENIKYSISAEIK